MGERFPKTSNSQDFGVSFQVRKRQEAKISSANHVKRLHLGSLCLANRPEVRTLAARGKGVRPFGGLSNLNCKSHARRGSDPFSTDCWSTYGPESSLPMSQTTVTNFDKAAVLITSLSPGAQDKVLELLGPDFAGKLRPILTAVSRRKDFGSLTEQVLQEFRELQAEVRASVSGSPNLQRTDVVDTSSATSAPDVQSIDKSEQAADQSDSTTPDEKSTESSNPSSEDPAGLESLMKLPPVVLGAGLKRESPRMIATVLKQLPAEFTGRVLEVLPPEVRQSTFLLMADTVQVNPAVVRRIMQKLCEVCQTIDPAEVEQQDRRVKSLIGILQSVEREERIKLLESLTERDPELATQIDNLMYDFTDVMRLEDRSIQKLLSQLEQKIVAMALKTAPEDLRQKVLKNLSERVRAALNEEMELLATVPPSKAEAARREVANVIRAQDKEGTLVWLE